MKKHLKTTIYIIIYLIAVFIPSYGIGKLWFSGILPESISQKYYDIISFLAFVITISIYELILKARKKSIIKTCNFSKLDSSNLILLTIAGILMGTITCLLCNTNFVEKNIPIFEQFLNYQVYGYNNFVIFLIMVAVTYAMEEMIFRGVIFNEIRNSISLYPAIIVSALLYGFINVFTMGIAIGAYAAIAALLYTLAYVFARSILASITLQVTSIYVIAISIKTGLWVQLKRVDDTYLYIGVIVLLLAVLGAYRYLYIRSRIKNQDDNEKEKEELIYAKP